MSIFVISALVIFAIYCFTSKPKNKRSTKRHSTDNSGGGVYDSGDNSTNRKHPVDTDSSYSGDSGGDGGGGDGGGGGGGD